MYHTSFQGIDFGNAAYISLIYNSYYFEAYGSSRLMYSHPKLRFLRRHHIAPSPKGRTSISLSPITLQAITSRISRIPPSKLPIGMFLGDRMPSHNLSQRYSIPNTVNTTLVWKTPIFSNSNSNSGFFVYILAS